MAPIIRFEDLSKTYTHRRQPVQALNELSFTVDRGQIYGFLGPNGAGKTTSIRILLNLIYPTSGEAYLFDTPVREANAIRQQRVGALVEDATFYPFMSGYDNLRVLAQTSGVDDHKRIDHVLALVGMAEFAHRRTRTYSTGMKQRLGVAAALINKPELLILDEPTSGLDPQGILDMRHLLKHLALNEGMTIFLSSHLLHEVEQTCDYVAIIHRGSLIKAGPVSTMVGGETIVQVDAAPVDKAHLLLADHFTSQVVDNSLEIVAQRDDIPAIIEKLVAHDIAVYSVTTKKRSLEDLFLEATRA